MELVFFVLFLPQLDFPTSEALLNADSKIRIWAKKEKYTLKAPGVWSKDRTTSFIIRTYRHHEIKMNINDGYFEDEYNDDVR